MVSTISTLTRRPRLKTHPTTQGRNQVNIRPVTLAPSASTKTLFLHPLSCTRNPPLHAGDTTGQRRDDEQGKQNVTEVVPNQQKAYPADHKRRVPTLRDHYPINYRCTDSTLPHVQFTRRRLSINSEETVSQLSYRA